MVTRWVRSALSTVEVSPAAATSSRVAATDATRSPSTTTTSGSCRRRCVTRTPDDAPAWRPLTWVATLIFDGKALVRPCHHAADDPTSTADLPTDATAIRTRTRDVRGWSTARNVASASRTHVPAESRRCTACLLTPSARACVRVMTPSCVDRCCASVVMRYRTLRGALRFHAVGFHVGRNLAVAQTRGIRASGQPENSRIDAGRDGSLQEVFWVKRGGCSTLKCQVYP